MKKSVCCILNHAPHYRKEIFQLMDEKFNCSFYFGDKVISPVKQMDFEILSGFKSMFKTKWIFGTSFIWNGGVIKLIIKKYDNFLIMAEPHVFSTWVFLILAKILNKKVFVWGHGIKDLSKRKFSWLERTFFKLPYRTFVYGNLARNNMITLGYKSDKIVCIYNSLGYNEQVEVRKNTKKSDVFNTHFGNDNPVVIYVGRILISKKLDQLVKAINLLLKKKTNVNLAIIGPEVDDKSIPELVKTLGISKNTWFYGPCYDEKELANLFFNAQLSVTPGDIGLSAIHSLMYGCPIVTHNNFGKHGPEFEVIIEGKTGSYFIENDVKDLAEKISYWLCVNKEIKEQAKQRGKHLIDNIWNPYNQVKIFDDTFV